MTSIILIIGVIYGVVVFLRTRGVISDNVNRWMNRSEISEY